MSSNDNFNATTANAKSISRRLLVTFLLVTLTMVFVLQAQISFAHARLQSATIAPDSTITTVPATLSITFNEEPTPNGSRIQVLDSTGKVVDKGDAKFNSTVGTVSLGTLPDGKYTVKYRAFTEDDSGIVDGEYTFTVAASGNATSGTGKPQEVASSATPAAGAGSAPSAPAAGIGGSTSGESGSNLVLVVTLLALTSLVASSGFLVVRKQAKK
ncbi:MAG: copper resistance protein CopC [Chloroflexi bacterium]|nr:copper resistance protein CopC [Chloroflexota bacterium]OJV88340.1 MAG: hypothetical protein BGO39_23980 [Chloroflexi bacterium 54-19]